MCAEHRDKFDTTWSITAVSTLATLACTGEYIGNVSRYCSSDGKWEEPNYSNCIGKSIQHIKNKYEKEVDMSSFSNPLYFNVIRAQMYFFMLI